MRLFREVMFLSTVEIQKQRMKKKEKGFMGKE